MKLAFSHMLEMVSADAQVVLDVAVEWPAAGPRLRIDDVLDTSGKVSLIRSDNRLDREIAGFMADEAEKCPRLLAKAALEAALEAALRPEEVAGQGEAFRTVSPETQAELDAIDANIRNAAIMAPHIIVGSAIPRPEAPVAPTTSVAELRHECAKSNWHEHEGCTCSDETLLKRAAHQTPVASDIVPGFTPAAWLVTAQQGYDTWAAKPHNAKWVRKIDGTPIPNDLVVCIGTAFAEALAALSSELAEANERIDELEQQADDVSVEFEKELTRAIWVMLRRAGADVSEGMTAEQSVEWLDTHIAEVTKAREAVEAEAARLKDALTPSAETKAAYIGEFSFPLPYWDTTKQEEATRQVDVPWTTIKAIMAAIRARSLTAAKGG